MKTLRIAGEIEVCVVHVLSHSFSGYTYFVVSVLNFAVTLDTVFSGVRAKWTCQKTQRKT